MTASQNSAPSPARPAPLRPGAIRLMVQNPLRTAAFYRDIVGLDIVEEAPRRVSLGAGGRAFVHLETRPGLIAAGPRAAGLFHAAFLLPDRERLGAWLLHAVEKRAPIVGASDHIVSEAVYLSDPEGNGVEIYADRPPARWRGPGGDIRMSTGPLDLDALAAAAKGPWTGFPEGGTLGHVHLQAGALDEADRFWRDLLGMELTTRYPGASFYATGGYHHHVAANVWNSRGAPRRRDNQTGLAEMSLIARDDSVFDRLAERIRKHGIRPEIDDGDLLLRDPWNIAVRITKE